MMSSQLSHTHQIDDDDFPPDNPFMSSDISPPPLQTSTQQQGQPQPSSQRMNLNQNPPSIPIDDMSFRPAMDNDTLNLTGNMDKNAAEPSNNASNNSNNSGINLPVPKVFSFQTYAKYFDFDTIDIQNRIVGAVKFANTPDYFRENILGIHRSDGKGPDLYGPIWITITLVFFVALTSNVSKYIHSDNGGAYFEYDISHLVNAMWVLCSFVVFVPAANFVLFRCVGVSCFSFFELVCLYGYSLVAFFPATILCLLPMTGWDWTVLLLATALSSVLVLRNVAGPILQQLSTQQQKAGPILIFIMVNHFIFFLVMKFMFYHHSSNDSTPTTPPPTPSPTIATTEYDGSGDN
mmetsp:Transcript_20447/g.19664  ORF Transcript_20447/g.19664 Transcript_20447/m.19664 type:complete len:349 (-) Transcript_20447:226-1272(-)|eukprot:CAMPEP_0197835882 /NCGR_PEP_ID=MMETSP1437-20131217/27254_1 /TAXON_ID=49252 ORGANISM="Eucampia antarctica, Strain CCMP1452" /NCGR_SAMPLE_ID=MMETSP1437 /ASSEMBLY_ACC=CAM_ASM_001096 /LENGTH=348 /DNA_ID=CAMNT_0043441621 /DNA_START=87 /DNA_END=1133 /DNA_ORIENTATION=-